MSRHATGAIAATFAVLGLSLGGCTRPDAAGPPGPSPDVLAARAAQAPPDELAQSWLTNDELVSMTSAARKGATIEVAGAGEPARITPANADSYEKTFASRLAMYGAAIEQRGYAAFAGQYTLSANKACADAYAPGYLLHRAELFASPAMGAAGGGTVRITQDKFRLTLSDTLALTGTSAGTKTETTTIDSRGAAVETALVLWDATSSDIVYHGTKSGRTIQLRPWSELIRAAFEPYPTWIPRPKWEALASCVMTLTAVP
jgi:hypothetical protein